MRVHDVVADVETQVLDLGAVEVLDLLCFDCLGNGALLLQAAGADPPRRPV
jgi:hypothetical protein